MPANQEPTFRDQVVALLTENTAIGRLDAEWAAGALASAELLRPGLPSTTRDPDRVVAVVRESGGDSPADVLYAALRTWGGGELEDEAARLIDALRDAGWAVERAKDEREAGANRDADMVALPEPSGPVEPRTWGWVCGNMEATDLDDAEEWAEELPQNIADARAIAAHIRALPATEQVWLDPEPLVPRPEPEGADTGVELSRAAVDSARSIMIMEGQINAPRVFRAGDPEPADVWVVLDRDGDVWLRSSGGGWLVADHIEPWGRAIKCGPLVEVFLPEPVIE